MREMRIAECGLRNCQKSLNQAEHRRQWPRASCNSAIRIPHFFSPRARPGLKPFGNSAFRNPHSAFPLLPYDRNEANADCGMRIAKLPLACRHSYSAWSQAFWQFRISQSAFRVSPTSLLADRNFEPGAVGFQSAPMSGFIKSQIR